MNNLVVNILYIVPEFQFPPLGQLILTILRQTVKKLSVAQSPVRVSPVEGQSLFSKLSRLKDSRFLSVRVKYIAGSNPFAPQVPFASARVPPSCQASSSRFFANISATIYSPYVIQHSPATSSESRFDAHSTSILSLLLFS